MVYPIRFRPITYRNRALHDSGCRFFKILWRGVVLVWNVFPDCVSGRFVPGHRRTSLSNEIKIFKGILTLKKEISSAFFRKFECEF